MEPSQGTDAYPAIMIVSRWTTRDEQATRPNLLIYFSTLHTNQSKLLIKATYDINESDLGIKQGGCMNPFILQSIDIVNIQLALESFKKSKIC